MDELLLKIKLAFVIGMKEIVSAELRQCGKFLITRETPDTLYAKCPENFSCIKKLKSVSRAYLILESTLFNPSYLSNHKSLIGSLIEKVIQQSEPGAFRTFKITCAGSGTEDVRSIARYIEATYGLSETEDADLKIHIIKNGQLWEVGAQITPRPLSVRAYKIENMSGAIDPTIAYAVNSLCNLEHARSYLNIFSGSATLLVEAGEKYPNLERLVGFDNDKKHLSLAIQNIKAAGLIKKIELKEADIFSAPDFGIFDVIVSDLPFGMTIAKGEDLERLYTAFIEYSGRFLNEKGMLAVYTSEYEIFEKLIPKSKYKIVQTVELRSTTAVNAYLHTKIILCRFK